MPLDPLHARVIAIAAALPEARTIALAGGGAMLAHGIVDRATKDVDLFTDRDSVEAVTVAGALRIALESAGFSIRPAPRPPHENRFVAIEPSAGAEVLVEVFPDGGRLHDPVHLDVGPVLHRDDLAADKTLAMWGRGEPRDFVDVIALLNEYSEDALIRLAGEKDRGFTAESFAVSLRLVERIIPRRWEVAGVSPQQAAAIRATLLDWADRLTP